MTEKKIRRNMKSKAEDTVNYFPLVDCDRDAAKQNKEP